MNRSWSRSVAERHSKITQDSAPCLEGHVGRIPEYPRKVPRPGINPGESSMADMADHAVCIHEHRRRAPVLTARG